MSPTAERLRSILCHPDRVRPDEPLKKHTTLRIGGPADVLVEVGELSELQQVLSFATAEQIPVYILGNGSNLLVADEGVRGIVLVLGGRFGEYRLDGARVTAGGGCNLPKLAYEVAKAGLGGLEFACSIPGTLGAGLMINAGAHGGELVQVVLEATVIHADGRIATLSADEIGLGYRSSRLQSTSAIVTEVVMQLHPADPAAMQEKMKHYLEKRRASQPLKWPNAGSFFKNPPGDFAGRLIEQAGLKGLTVGGAQISEQHANFVINLGGATAADVANLANQVRTEVQQRFGVRLEPEVKVWGNVPHFGN